MWSRTMKLSNDDTVTVLLCIIILICTLHCTPCKCHLERVRDISPPWRLRKQSYQHLLDVILLEDGCWHGQENGILLVGAQIIQDPHQHRAAYNIDLGHFFCRNPSISTNPSILDARKTHQVAASSPGPPLRFDGPLHTQFWIIGPSSKKKLKKFKMPQKWPMASACGSQLPQSQHQSHPWGWW